MRFSFTKEVSCPLLAKRKLSVASCGDDDGLYKFALICIYDGLRVYSMSAPLNKVK